jgi:predicted Zn-dependent peptidase
MGTGSPARLTSIRPLATTLANGLRVVAVNLPTVHRVAVVTHVRVGSRYETTETNGASHLLEHMLYRGIPGYSTAHDQALAFETMGGTLVAGTGSDSGSLSISCPKESFERIVELLSLVYARPLLNGLEVEKRIVREEILEDLDEDGALVDDYDLLRATAFEGHPLGFSVIGTIGQVDRLELETLRQHHRRHYVGAGTVISIAGPLDPEAAVRAIERHYGHIAQGDSLPIEAPSEQKGEPRIRFVPHSSSQTALRIGFRGAGTRDAAEPATELLLRLLDDGNATRLYSRLCDERGLAYDVSAGYEAADDVGLFEVGCEMAHERADTVLAEIFDVLRDLRDAGPNQAELEKAKVRHRWSLEEMLDNPGELAEFVADATLRGYAISPAEREARIDSVDAEGVRDAATQLLRPEGLSAVFVGKQPKRSLQRLIERVRAFR